MIISSDRISNEMSKNFCKYDESGKKLILSLLKQADIDVEDIVIKKPNISLKDLPKNIPEEFKQQIAKELAENFDVFFIHLDNQGNKVAINLHDESDGTQKVFEFSSLSIVTLETTVFLPSPSTPTISILQGTLSDK